MGEKNPTFCQELANILGVSVFAADTIVYYYVTERTWSWWFTTWFVDNSYDHDPSTIVSVDVKLYHTTDDGEMDKSRPG